MPPRTSPAEEWTDSAHYGKRWADQLGLPVSAFPPGHSFAFSPLQTKAKDRRDLAANLAHGPSPSNNSAFDQDEAARSINGLLSQQFHTINARFSRAGPSTRLYSRSQRLTLLPQLPCGGALVVTQFLQADGSLSPPSILVLGPSAVPPFGELVSSPEYIQHPEPPRVAPDSPRQSSD